MRAVLWISLVLLLLAGCQSMGLRNEPTEPMKQTAWLTKEIAEAIEKEGTVAHSPGAKKMVEGAKAAAYYYGLPKTPPDMSQFDTLAPQAQLDAQEKPDPFQVADGVLGLAIAGAALFGGGGAVKVVQKLKTIREKSKAFAQVVKNNELYKEGLSKDQRETFGKYQRNQQTPEQHLLITQAKTNGRPTMVIKAPPEAG